MSQQAQRGAEAVPPVASLRSTARSKAVVAPVPIPLTRFVGRANELAELVCLLRDSGR
jgi:hypothetical protein